MWLSGHLDYSVALVSSKGNREGEAHVTETDGASSRRIPYARLNAEIQQRQAHLDARDDGDKPGWVPPHPRTRPGNSLTTWGDVRPIGKEYASAASTSGTWPSSRRDDTSAAAAIAAAATAIPVGTPCSIGRAPRRRDAVGGRGRGALLLRASRAVRGTGRPLRSMARLALCKVEFAPTADMRRVLMAY